MAEVIDMPFGLGLQRTQETMY